MRARLWRASPPKSPRWTKSWIFTRLAGDVDYFLRVVVPDAAAFDAFYKRLIETMPLKKVTSRFALENIKSETAFPIDC
jgi:Lrp/AsnC family transcriptional regulator